MALELQTPYNGAGATLYAILRRKTDGYVWQTTTDTFVAWVNANIANYDIPLADQGGDLYAADMPSAMTVGVGLDIFYYVMAGATPALTDSPTTIKPYEEKVWLGNALSTPGSGTGNYMTLDTARSILTNSVLHVGASSYTAAKLDNAIMICGNYFVEQTKCAKSTFTITTVNGTKTFNPTTTAADFEPDNVLNADISDWPVLVTPWRNISMRYGGGSAESGKPRYMGFRSRTEGIFYPTPDDAYSLNINYWLPFTSWTAGTGSPGSVTLNIPQRFMYQVLWYGAGPSLISGQAGTTALDNAWRKFEDWVERCKGASTTGPVDFVWDPAQYE